MNNRFQFRAIIPVSYYDKNGDDRETVLCIENIAVYSEGAVGCSENDLHTAIINLNLPESESDSIRDYIENNYSTESDLWYFFDNANIIIEQCTGLKDKNGNLIYENDLIKTANYKTGLPEIYAVKWCDECGLYQLESTQSDQIIDMYRAEKGIICGNIHETKDNK